MSAPEMIRGIQAVVSIPVMAKIRIGHTVEARILEALEVDFIDESEVLTPADPFSHVDKRDFRVPFVCGATCLGEALRRISEGASMIRTKGEAGTGNVIEAVRHIKTMAGEIEGLKSMSEKALQDAADEMRVSVELLCEVRDLGRLPVVNFAAGGVATPADAALCMELGCDGVFVGSGIFKASDPAKVARAVVEAVIHFRDPVKLAAISEGLGEAMPGLEISKLELQMQQRGW